MGEMMSNKIWRLKGNVVCDLADLIDPNERLV